MIQCEHSKEEPNCAKFFYYQSLQTLNTTHSKLATHKASNGGTVCRKTVPCRNNTRPNETEVMQAFLITILIATDNHAVAEIYK